MGCYRFCTFSWAAGVKVWNTVDLSPGRTQQSSIPLEDGRRGVYSVFHLPPVPLGGSLGQALITFWPLLVCKVSCLGFPQIRAVKHLKLSCNLDLFVLYLGQESGDLAQQSILPFTVSISSKFSERKIVQVSLLVIMVRPCLMCFTESLKTARSS
jgi:hypothetical protein